MKKKSSFFVLVAIFVLLFAAVATVIGCQNKSKPPAKTSSEETSQKENDEKMTDMEDLNEQQMAGLEVFNAKGCIACHTVNNKGGNVGPDLSGTGKMHTREELEKQIRTPRDKMPKIEMSETELKNLIEYLMTLKADMDDADHN